MEFRKDGIYMNILLLAQNTGTAWWRVRNPLELLRDSKIANLTWLSPDQVPTRDIQFL